MGGGGSGVRATAAWGGMVAGGSRGRGWPSGANGGWWVGSESEGSHGRMGVGGLGVRARGTTGEWGLAARG